MAILTQNFKEEFFGRRTGPTALESLVLDAPSVAKKQWNKILSLIITIEFFF